MEMETLFPRKSQMEIPFQLIQCFTSPHKISVMETFLYGNYVYNIVCIFFSHKHVLWHIHASMHKLLLVRFILMNTFSSFLIVWTVHTFLSAYYTYSCETFTFFSALKIVMMSQWVITTNILRNTYFLLVLSSWAKKTVKLFMKMSTTKKSFFTVPSRKRKGMKWLLVLFPAFRKIVLVEKCFADDLYKNKSPWGMV